MVGNFLLLCAAITGAITLSVIASVEVIWEAICGHGAKQGSERFRIQEATHFLAISLLGASPLFIPYPQAPNFGAKVLPLHA